MIVSRRPDRRARFVPAPCQFVRAGLSIRARQCRLVRAIPDSSFCDLRPLAKNGGGAISYAKIRVFIVSSKAVTQLASLVAPDSSNHNRDNVMRRFKRMFSLVLAASALVASAQAAPIIYDITNDTVVQSGYSLSGYIEVSGTGNDFFLSSFNLIATKADNPTLTFSSGAGAFGSGVNLHATDSALYVPDGATLQITNYSQSLNWLNGWYGNTFYSGGSNVSPYTIFWNSETFPVTDENGWRIGSVQAVPEPSTYCMALAGLACGGWQMWRRRRLRQASTLAA